jgi:hypothetical protein
MKMRYEAYHNLKQTKKLAGGREFCQNTGALMTDMEVINKCLKKTHYGFEKN